MKVPFALMSVVCAVCVGLLVHRPGVRAQEGAETAPTRTVIGDLLMIDRDLYIVRGEGGEIHIEATARTEVTEDFQFGDRIKAVVLTNNKALKIERAGPRDVPGVVKNQPAPAAASEAQDAGADTDAVSAPPTQPTQKTIVGDLLMIDRDLYIVRGEGGEIHIEVTARTEVAEDFQFSDRIKAVVLMNNKALTIERAGPGDVPGIIVHGGAESPRAAQGEAEEAGRPVASGAGQAHEAASSAVEPGGDTTVVEGQLLMIDGDFYVIRGERGEIRIERTPETRMAEEFKFGDFIRATMTPADRALTIERLQ